MLMQPACAVLLLSRCLVPVYEIFSFSRQVYEAKHSKALIFNDEKWMIDNFCAPIAAMSTRDSWDFITACNQRAAVIFYISKLCEHQLFSLSFNMKNYYTKNIEI